MQFKSQPRPGAIQLAADYFYRGNHLLIRGIIFHHFYKFFSGNFVFLQEHLVLRSRVDIIADDAL